ncbi:hypothetical protein FACS1894216_01950 [Synergistales bacterium]|nr:hypothetical protein FACS1894216_01950 [Synergistales bacterium]
MNEKALFGALSTFFALICIVCAIQFDNSIVIALSAASGAVVAAVMLYLALNVQTEATLASVVEALERQQSIADETRTAIAELTSVVSANAVEEVKAITDSCANIADSASKATEILGSSLKRVEQATAAFNNVFPKLTDLQTNYANVLANSFNNHIQKQTDHIASVQKSFTKGLEVLESKQNDLSANVADALAKSAERYSDLTNERKELCDDLIEDLDDVNDQFEEFLKKLKELLDNYNETADKFGSATDGLKRGVDGIGKSQEDFLSTFSKTADGFDEKLARIIADFSTAASVYKESIDRQQELQKEDNIIIGRILNGK